MKSRSFFFIACFRSYVILLSPQFTFTQFSEDPLLIKTHSGWVQGKYDTSATGKQVQAFLGIPYAEPPLGNLRFKPPLPVKEWSDVFNATAFPNSCMKRLLRVSYHIPVLKKQVSLTPLSEDCLKLNIWVPSDKPSKAPVIVFIHGGGYSFGSSVTPISLGDALSSEGEVIVVTFNYRLASFGFLFLDHVDSPGNAGLYDQRLAIEWVYKNIAAFGGDPDNIILFGQSAGSSSVLFHLISRKLDHAFNRIILSSTPRVSYVIMDHEVSKNKGMQLVENVGCTSKNVTKIIECLRIVDPEEIINNEPGEGYNNVIFLTITDGDIVPTDPKKIFKEGNFKHVDALIGSNKDEGTMFLMLSSPHVYQPVRDEVKPTKQDYLDMMHDFMKIKSSIMSKSVEIQYRIASDEADSARIKEASEKTINDVLIACPTKRYVSELAETGKKVFAYFFVHPPAGSFAPKWFGAFHGSDLFYTFGDVFSTRPTLPKTELDFGSRIMRYWSNFAHTGDPNQGPNGRRENIIWPQYRLEDRLYLVLAPNSTAVARNPRERHCSFWEKFMPLLAHELGFPDSIIDKSFGF